MYKYDVINVLYYNERISELVFQNKLKLYIFCEELLYFNDAVVETLNLKQTTNRSPLKIETDCQYNGTKPGSYRFQTGKKRQHVSNTLVTQGRRYIR